MIESISLNQQSASDHERWFKDRSIAIFGLNYWPEETGNAPYTTGLAEYLAALGSNVMVVSGFPYYPQWKIEDAYAGRLRQRESRNAVTILRHKQYIPAQQTAVRRAGFEFSFLANAATSRLPRRPDLILGILPALADGMLAMMSAKRYRVPYGMLIQDLVGQSAAQSGIAGGGRVAKTTANIEASSLRRASRIAVVSDGFIPAITQFGIDPHKIDLVPNWCHVDPPSGNPQQRRQELGWASDVCVVLHAGNMGLKQGLENVVDAARVAHERQLPIRFVLMGDGNQRAMLEQRAAGLPTILFKDPAPKEEFTSILAAADMLLVNERESVVDMSLPSKLTSYYVAGRPIIGAVSLNGVTSREISRSGAGVVVSHGDPAALVDQIEHLRNSRERCEELGEKGPRYAREHLSVDTCLERAAGFVRRIA